jgi:hypothetical protein
VYSALRVAGSERQLVPSAAAIATMARRASMVELENIVENFWTSGAPLTRWSGSEFCDVATKGQHTGETSIVHGVLPPSHHQMVLLFLVVDHLLTCLCSSK